MTQIPPKMRAVHLLDYDGKPESLRNHAREPVWLSDWMRDRNVLSHLRVAGQVQKLLTSDLKTEIQARFPLEDVAPALELYAAYMTAGKVLLIPSRA